MAFVRPPFARLEWLFPIAITAHNIEEAIWLPGFVAAHRTELPWTVAPGEFRVAAAVVGSLDQAIGETGGVRSNGCSANRRPVAPS